METMGGGAVRSRVGAGTTGAQGAGAAHSRWVRGVAQELAEASTELEPPPLFPGPGPIERCGAAQALVRPAPGALCQRRSENVCHWPV